MKSIANPIAHRALEKALQAARNRPRPRTKTDSRTADKFIVRGYEELFTELAGIGLHQGRSANSEMVAAVLEALAGYERSNAMLRILKGHLGEALAQCVLAEVPNFDLQLCREPDSFVIRFPAQVRDTVRDGVRHAAKNKTGGRQHSMNKWLLEALVVWFKIQRQQFALLSAAIEHEKEMLGGASLGAVSLTSYSDIA